MRPGKCHFMAPLIIYVYTAEFSGGTIAIDSDKGA